LASLWLPRLGSLGNSGRTTRPLPSASKPISPVVCATTRRVTATCSLMFSCQESASLGYRWGVAGSRRGM